MTVYAGPGEATAIGNIASQMIAAKELYDLKAARQCIFDSFEIKEYPRNIKYVDTSENREMKLNQLLDNVKMQLTSGN